MAKIITTSDESTLVISAYCALYEIIKEGIDNTKDLKLTLQRYIQECDTLPQEERTLLKPIYQKAYDISCDYSFPMIKELTKQVGSDYSKDL